MVFIEKILVELIGKYSHNEKCEQLFENNNCRHLTPSKAH